MTAYHAHTPSYDGLQTCMHSNFTTRLPGQYSAAVLQVVNIFGSSLVLIVRINFHLIFLQIVSEAIPRHATSVRYSSSQSPMLGNTAYKNFELNERKPFEM